MKINEFFIVQMKTGLTYQLQVPQPMALISIGPAFTFPTFTAFVPSASTIYSLDNNTWHSNARKDSEKDEIISFRIFHLTSTFFQIWSRRRIVSKDAHMVLLREIDTSPSFKENMTHCGDGCFDVRIEKQFTYVRVFINLYDSMYLHYISFLSCDGILQRNIYGRYLFFL